jgi:phosphoribosyl-dephospho-CoA transferase
MSDETKTEQEDVVWTEELLQQRRKRAAIMAVALLAFIALFFWVTLVKLGANIANRPL